MEDKRAGGEGGREGGREGERGRKRRKTKWRKGREEEGPKPEVFL